MCQCLEVAMFASVFSSLVQVVKEADDAAEGPLVDLLQDGVQPLLPPNHLLTSITHQVLHLSHAD